MEDISLSDSQSICERMHQKHLSTQRRQKRHDNYGEIQHSVSKPWGTREEYGESQWLMLTMTSTKTLRGYTNTAVPKKKYWCVQFTLVALSSEEESWRWFGFSVCHQLNWQWSRGPPVDGSKDKCAVFKHVYKTQAWLTELMNPYLTSSSARLMPLSEEETSHVSWRFILSSMRSKSVIWKEEQCHNFQNQKAEYYQFW
jgi:hypothetical protein